MKTEILSGWNKAVTLGVLSAVWVGGAPAFAKEVPKFSMSDREVDRATRATSYAPVIKRVTSSVVTIESTRTRSLVAAPLPTPGPRRPGGAAAARPGPGRPP